MAKMMCIVKRVMADYWDLVEYKDYNPKYDSFSNRVF